MEKHKIVQFINGIAKVSITDDFTPFLSKEDNKNLFINPDLTYVHKLSPEYWTVKDGVLWPLEPDEIKKRREIMEIQADVPTKSDHRRIEQLISDIKIHKDTSDDNFKRTKVVTDFKFDETKALFNSKLNTLDINIKSIIDEYKKETSTKFEEVSKKHLKTTKILSVLLAITTIIAIASCLKH